MSLYSINKEYELKEFYALRHETPDPCCKDDFADVTWVMHEMTIKHFFRLLQTFL